LTETKSDDNSRDDNSRYTEDIKAQAKELFLRGEPYSRISEEVRKTVGGKCTAALIKKWADDSNWLADKTKMMKRVSDKMVSFVSDDLYKRSKKQLDAYRQMIDKGEAAIDAGTVTVDRKGEAIDLIDKGIRGERQISAGLVSLDAIEYLARIIAEEVSDDETKRRIVMRFQKFALEVLRL